MATETAPPRRVHTPPAIRRAAGVGVGVHDGNPMRPPVSRGLPTVENLPRYARALVLLTCYHVADPPRGALEHFIDGPIDRPDTGQSPGLQGRDGRHHPRFDRA